MVVTRLSVNPQTQNPITNPSDAPRVSSIRGNVTCLPKKGDGPHTMECAMGIRALDGKHYAVDVSDLVTPLFDIAAEQQITLTGLVVPIEQMSSDQWKTYDIVGIMKASELSQ